MKNLKKIVTFSKKAKFIYELKESIDQYDIYIIEQSDMGGRFEQSCLLRNSKIEKLIFYEKDPSLAENSKFNRLFSMVNTFGTSTTGTQTSTESSLNQLHINKKENQKTKNKQYFQFTYYIILVNVLVLILIIIFLVIELRNNQKISATYNLITNYYDFQNYFYSVSLSISSLICKPNTNNNTKCNNAFLEYSLK